LFPRIFAGLLANLAQRRGSRLHIRYLRKSAGTERRLTLKSTTSSKYLVRVNRRMNSEFWKLKSTAIFWTCNCTSDAGKLTKRESVGADGGQVEKTPCGPRLG